MNRGLPVCPKFKVCVYVIGAAPHHNDAKRLWNQREIWPLHWLTWLGWRPSSEDLTTQPAPVSSASTLASSCSSLHHHTLHISCAQSARKGGELRVAANCVKKCAADANCLDIVWASRATGCTARNCVRLAFLYLKSHVRRNPYTVLCTTYIYTRTCGWCVSPNMRDERSVRRNISETEKPYTARIIFMVCMVRMVHMVCVVYI